MENRWTLHVEDFGRIEQADVTVSPLTLFVGDNNSGKSYLMSLIYALLNGNLGVSQNLRTIVNTTSESVFVRKFL